MQANSLFGVRVIGGGVADKARVTVHVHVVPESDKIILLDVEEIQRMLRGRGKVGVLEFNAWRKKHPEAHIDLRGANLSNQTSFYLDDIDFHGADLRGADLNDIYLTRANLCFADLRGARLNDAKLQGADLRSANLRGADLELANLRGADLRGADLNGARILYAHFDGADLRDVDFRNCFLSDAFFNGADITGRLT